MTNWETCVQFHGHACGGLTIGYKAACYAAELLELSFSGDEQVVCIAENDACGVDAIQVVTGCTMGKGNLMSLLMFRAPAIRRCGMNICQGSTKNVSADRCFSANSTAF